ncbi:unnamed protein product [Moneuplotes crassus]|uniref:Uncharacterized protein n=1 Tax=Euplotes crassus TaxID=5936 RepID=A0AAD2DD40_EUPCR|nr:unnamed protein product [Moneuplotes crassus]
MDLQATISNFKALAKEEDHKPQKNPVLQTYVLQNKKFAKTIREVEHLKRQFQTQSALIANQQRLINDCMTLAAYKTHSKLFEKDFEKSIKNKIDVFRGQVLKEIPDSKDIKVFGKPLEEYFEQYNNIFQQVNRMQLDIYDLKQQLKMKADEKLQMPSASEAELFRLGEIKADKSEIEALRQEIDRLEQMMVEVEGEYDESYDEYDDEDSEVEDVISLDEAGISNHDKEDNDEEDFFDESQNSQDPNKAIAEKVKNLTKQNFAQGAIFEPSAKLGEKDEKAKEEEKGKQEKELKEKEAKKEEEIKVNEDLPVEEEKKEPKKIDDKTTKDPSKKSEDKKRKSSNAIDCAETNHSLGQTMNNFNQKPINKDKIKSQSTMKSRGGRLNRMTSKLSIATRKMRGSRKGGNHKEVNELKLNIKKLQEDVQRLNKFENESAVTSRRFESTLVDLKKKNDLFVNQHNKILKKQEEMENQHSSALENIKKETLKVVKIHKDIKKLISDFKAEYRYGFKKIIKAEVDINFLLQQMKFIKTKIKPKDEEKLDKNKLLGEIDGKFELLYGQVSEMATEQAFFNSSLQKEHENLKEPIKNEISKIREESNIMLRELERTQNNHREILNSKMNMSINLETPGKRLTKRNLRHSTPVNHSSASINLRKFNASAQKQLDFDFFYSNKSNGAINNKKGNSIHLMNFTPNIKMTPNHSGIDKRLKSLEKQRRKIGTTLSTPKYNRFKPSQC